MDIFEKFLEDSDDKTVALIDSSYKKIVQNQEHKNIKKQEVNTRLSTYGDALLKFLLCDILYEKEDKLTEQRKNYESDKVLVEKIAKRYGLIEKIKKDKEDKNLPDDYEYGEVKNNKNKHKYIATAVEACLAEMYISKKYKFEDMKKLIQEWIYFIDNK